MGVEVDDVVPLAAPDAVAAAARRPHGAAAPGPRRSGRPRRAACRRASGRRSRRARVDLRRRRRGAARPRQSGDDHPHERAAGAARHDSLRSVLGEPRVPPAGPWRKTVRVGSRLYGPLGHDREPICCRSAAGGPEHALARPRALPSRSSILPGFLPPASAKSGRPPPPPPTIGAISLTTWPACTSPIRSLVTDTTSETLPSLSDGEDDDAGAERVLQRVGQARAVPSGRGRRTRRAISARRRRHPCRRRAPPRRRRPAPP